MIGDWNEYTRMIAKRVALEIKEPDPERIHPIRIWPHGTIEYLISGDKTPRFCHAPPTDHEDVSYQQ